MSKNNTFSLKELSPPHKCMMYCELLFKKFWVGKILYF